MSMVQINPFRPSPSPSATWSFRFVVKVLSWGKKFSFTGTQTRSQRPHQWNQEEYPCCPYFLLSFWQSPALQSLYDREQSLLYRSMFPFCRSQWPRGLRRRSAAARLLRLWVRIPSVTWTFVCCKCCASSGLCNELITRPDESYRLWCVVVSDLETSWMRRPWPIGGCRAKNKQKFFHSI